MKDDTQYYETLYSPMIFINNNMYRGSFTNIDNIMETFCNSLENFPKAC